MFIFNKPSEYHIDCFTDRKSVYDYTPLGHANEFFPSWWKELPKSYVPKGRISPQGTMKGCYGFVELYRNSLVIPMWSDFLVEDSSNSFTGEFSDSLCKAQAHEPEQKGKYLPNHSHIKLLSPWHIKSKDAINCMVTKPVYSYDDPDDFFLFPGMFEFKYQHSTNLNLAFKRPLEGTQQFFIPAGQPIAQLIPLTEKKLVIHKHLVSKDEVEQLISASCNTTFVGKYRFNRKAIEK